MRSPSLSWVGYNLLRLTSIVILCWALAVQFIAIGDDMSAYSTSLTSSSTTDTVNKGDPTSSSSKNPYAAPTIKPSSSLTTSAAIGAITSSSSKRGVKSLHERKVETVMVNRAFGSGGDTGEANWGLSSIPRHAGGAVFAIISRIVMVCTFSLLMIGQLGWPEMFLYNWVPWLGAQSTPVWLGTVQTIVAIENLRVYAKSTVLLPSWALFAIGLINVLIGSILLYLGRKLPKYPPAPLYFNLSTRLIYFQPPPKCYDPIRYPQRTLNNDPESQLEMKKKLPPSNLKSIGLDSDNDEDSKDWGGGDERISIHSERGLPIQSQYQQKRVPPPSEPRNDFKDISKGGYPTFSGGGLVDPGTQVPLGFIEHTKDGRKIEFVTNNDGNGLPPISNKPDGGTKRSISPPTAWKGAATKAETKVQKRSELPPRGQSKSLNRSQTTVIPKTLFDDQKRDLGRVRADSVDTLALISRGNFNTIKSNTDGGKNVNPFEVANLKGMDSTEISNKQGRKKKSTLSSLTFGPSPLGSPQKTPKSNSPEPQLAEETAGEGEIGMNKVIKRSDSKKGKKDIQERQSSASYLSAAREIGPRFPFPPSRQTSLKRSTVLSLNSERGDSDGEVVSLSPEDLQPSEQEKEKEKGGGLVIEPKGPRPPFRAPSKREKPTTDHRPPKSPKSPKSARSRTTASRPVIARRRSSTSSSSSAKRTTTTTSPKTSTNETSRISTRKRVATLATPHPAPPIRSSLTSLGRSSSTKSTKGARAARGVRFNLSPTKESDEEDSSWTAGGSGSASASEEEAEEEGRVSVPGGGMSLSVLREGSANAVGTPKLKMDRPDSMILGNSVVDTKLGASVNRRSRSRTVTERSDTKRESHQPQRGKTMVLGGEYLGGGNEHNL